MTKQFTIITKDGSKWLTVVPSKPIWGNEKEWMEEVLSEDLPYLGSHPEGTVLSEEQVTIIQQVRTPNTVWRPYVGAVTSREETRTAYTDVELLNEIANTH